MKYLLKQFKIHIILFFQTDAQVTLFIGFLFISSLLGVAVWSILKIQAARKKRTTNISMINTEN